MYQLHRLADILLGRLDGDAVAKAADPFLWIKAILQQPSMPFS